MADIFIFVRRHRLTRLITVAVGCALATSCDDRAVVWLDNAPVVSTAPSPLAHPPFVPIDSGMRANTPESDFLLVQDLIREAGAATLLTQTLLDMPEANESVAMGEMLPMLPVGVAPLTPMGDGDEPLDSARCARSLRMVLAPRRGRVAVWWSRRENSKVWLQAAWRDTIPAEGRLGAWRGPIIVDSVDQGPGDAQAADRGAAGCDRPAPSVVVDDTYGYVHVAYVLVGPEGPGVFYAHQMDPRAAFEVPAVIMYGERLGTVRVAASGNLVAVAYEDPNSGKRPRVGLAVSNTSGHTFADRLVASGSSSIAHDPYVAVRGRAIVEGWSELSSTGGEPVFRFRRALARK